MMESLTRIVLENESVRILVQPELGGKIASIFLKRPGLELLQQPLHSQRQRIWAQDFAASDASGWDECLPTIAACEVSVGTEVRRIPDHGDIWLLPTVHSATATEAHLETALVTMPLRLRRWITLDGSMLRVRYELRNEAAISLSYLWSAHPLFAVDAADRIVLPETVQTLRVEDSARKRLGRHGDLCSWPIAPDRHGSAVDLRIAQAPATTTADKLFAGPLQQGWAGLYRAQHQAGIVVRFAAEQLPYLGLWLCYGGWPDGSPQKQQSVALEPCMAPMDSLAEALVTGCACTLAAGKIVAWQMVCNLVGMEENVSYESFTAICASSPALME